MSDGKKFGLPQHSEGNQCRIYS